MRSGGSDDAKAECAVCRSGEIAAAHQSYSTCPGTLQKTCVRVRPGPRWRPGSARPEHSLGLVSTRTPVHHSPIWLQRFAHVMKVHS